MNKWVSIIALISLCIIACNKKEEKIGPAGNNGQNGTSGKDGTSDKQIRFELGPISSNLAMDTSILFINNYASLGLVQFNINNYLNVDSAVFVVYDVKTSESCCVESDIIKSMKIELYDITNNKPIINSEITTDDIKNGSYVFSKNIAKKFPNQTIDLGVRIIFDKNLYATTGRLFLFLYRK